MPKRDDIHKILIVGSGPIVIGQACEFDYSGTQACKAIREEGYEVVLLNSNPATIMTDPVMADRTYVEPITVEVMEKIIRREKPDALLATLGGQIALNTAVTAKEEGILDEFGVEMIGANYDAIQCAEDREKFQAALQGIGVDMARSVAAHSLEEAREIAEQLGYPILIRPSFTMGGAGASVAYNAEEFDDCAQLGLDLSLINEVLVEESILGWKEYELEVMRDRRDNVVIICAIENVDPMGIHTGGTDPAFGALLLLPYGVGHCSVIVAAGTSAELVQRCLNWNERSRGTVVVKKVCGVLVILGGLYLLWTA